MMSSTEYGRKDTPVVPSECGRVPRVPARFFGGAPNGNTHSPEAQPTVLAPAFPRTNAHTQNVERVIAPIESAEPCRVCSEAHFSDESCPFAFWMGLIWMLAIVLGTGCLIAMLWALASWLSGGAQ